MPEHTSPELVYAETKWSSLVSYGLVVQALRDFLPIDAKLSATSVRRNTLRVARRCERDLRTQHEAISRPSRSGQDVSSVVGIDGGYLRHWQHKHTYFVAIVGKSVPTSGERTRLIAPAAHAPCLTRAHVRYHPTLELVRVIGVSGKDVTTTMKFGVFYEHQYPRPWQPGGESRLFHEALDQVALADRLGIDHAWEVEHHFLEEYSHSSAPEVFLAAASQRTQHIRLSHGIVLMPPAYNPPARIAERIATLDIVSNGRVDFGTGESASRTELEGFMIDPGERRAMWRDTLEQVCNMLAMDPYPGYQGKYFSMPPRNIVPKPVQKPHPPLWVACSNRDTIHLAAQLGIGALTFTFIDAAEARHWVTDYYETFKRECVPIGHTVNPNIALVTGFSVNEDEQEALNRGIDGLRFFQFALAHFYRNGVHKPGRTDIWARYMAARDQLVAADLNPDQSRLTSNRGAIGTPEQVRLHLREFADIGVDQMVFIQQGGKNKHEDICASLELFAAKVMSEFHAEEEDRQRQKMAALAPYIEAAFQRKQYLAPLADEQIPEYPAYGLAVAEEKSRASVGD